MRKTKYDEYSDVEALKENLETVLDDFVLGLQKDIAIHKGLGIQKDIATPGETSADKVGGQTLIAAYSSVIRRVNTHFGTEYVEVPSLIYKIFKHPKTVLKRSEY